MSESQTADSTSGKAVYDAFDRAAAEMKAAHDAAVQRVIDRYQGDVRAMAVEIVRLRDELMVSEAISDD
jgi:hypothetical protein